MRGFLIDTNVLSDRVSAQPNAKVSAWLDQTEKSLQFISVLTLGEIRKGINLMPRGSRRIQLDAWLEETLRPFFMGRILPIEASVADRWAALMAEAKTSGRPFGIIDALIAATALDHNLILVTRNTRDLASRGVEILNPWVE